MSNITYKELHRVLNYNPKTGIFRWKIQNSNRVKIGDIAGNKSNKSCIRIRINKKEYKAHRLAWLYIYGYFPENNIDHKDRNPWHNWIDNLREATQKCNARNTGNRKDNKSGVKGIIWNKREQKYQTKITINQKQKHLGWFKDFDEAVCHRLAAEQCLNWSGCDSSSPAYQYVQKMLGKRSKLVKRK